MEKPSDKEQEAVVTRLVRAQEVKVPEVHTWHLIDLEQEEKKRDEEMRSTVYRRVEAEFREKLSRQTTLLKREAFEEAKQAGYEAGYQAGFETGQTQGLEKAEITAEQELAPKVQQLEAILANMVSPQQLLDRMVFQALAEMAVVLAERIVEKNIQLDQDYIIGVVEKSVKILPEGEARIEVELHPDDYQIVHYYQQKKELPWSLVANPQMDKGSCRVKKLNSVVNNNWKSQLTALLDQTQQVIASVSGLSNAPDDVLPNT